MKNLAILLAVTSAILISCGTQRLSTTPDDVYVNPVEEQKKQRLLEEEKAKQEALARQKAEEDRAAEKARIDSNPYYKDPQYKYEDYYDYEYASRLNRFSNPIGVGYYDSYYTNMYTYNQNPMYYGTSIYGSFVYGMPVAPHSSIGFGVSMGYGYNSGYGYYPGYGYHSFYDPFYNYGYGCGCNYYGGYGYPGSSYMMGYNAGYYMGSLYAPWPYYNSFDVNSGYGKVNVGPRMSSGGNSAPGRTGGESGIRESQQGQQKYFESVSQQQSNSPRFISRDQQRVRNAENGGTRIDGQRPVPNQPPPVDQRAREGDRNKGNDRIMQKQPEPGMNENTNRREAPVNNNSGVKQPSPRNTDGGGSTRPR